MQVDQYLFKSPSPSQVQVGRPDPANKDDSDTTGNTQQSAVQSKTAAEIMTGKTAESPEVKPTVNSDRLLDVYA